MEPSGPQISLADCGFLRLRRRTADTAAIRVLLFGALSVDGPSARLAPQGAGSSPDGKTVFARSSAE